MFRKKKIMLIYIFMLALVFVPNNVYAATTATFKSGGAAVKLDDGHCCTKVNKKVGGVIAYCLELDKAAPLNNTKVERTGSKYDKKSLVAGQIIKLGKAKYSGNNEYVKIQEALNCYFKEDGYHSGTCSNSAVKSLISNAKSAVDKDYKFVSGDSTAKLPAISFDNSRKLEVASVNGNVVNYISEKVTLSGMVSTYGGESFEVDKDGPSYRVYTDVKDEDKKKGVRAFICPEAKYDANQCHESLTLNGKESYSFYVYIANGGKNGGTVYVKAEGKNESKYPSIYRWKSSSKYQKLATYSSATGGTFANIKRRVYNETTFTYSADGTNSVSLAKVDETGQPLEGAKLTLFTASNEAGTEDKKVLCTVGSDENTKTSCAKSNVTEKNDGYVNGRYLCYSEEDVPNGYKKIETKCRKINLSDNDNTELFYVGEEEVKGPIYNKYNGAASFCITNSVPIDDDYINSQLNGAFTDNTTELVLKGTVTTLTKGACESIPATPEDENGGGTGSTTGNESGDGAGTTTGNETGDGTGSGTTTPTPTVYSQTICVAGDKTYDSTGIYCADHGPLGKFTLSAGNANIVITNALNVVNISKKAIAGTDEVPGATLSIYTTDSAGKCTSTLAKAKRFEFQESKSSTTDVTNTSEDSGSSSDSDSSSEDGTNDDVLETIEEEQVTSVVNGLKWKSSDAPAIIYGLASGTYCLVEEVPPVGYKKLTTTTKFSMDSSGGVKLVDAGSSKITDEKSQSETVVSTITLYNTLIDVTISKTDIVTTKELPGATLSICEAYKDENGNYEPVLGYNKECTVTTLADGSKATWVSTNTPHKVSGLGAGTYYLVETTAPNGYSTSESILFVVKEDGTLTDINGKSLKDSKIVMQDKPINDVKTGMFGIFVIIGFLAISGVAGVASYYKLKQNTINNV